jgi:hypothetical protein
MPGDQELAPRAQIPHWNVLVGFEAAPTLALPQAAVLDFWLANESVVGSGGAGPGGAGCQGVGMRLTARDGGGGAEAGEDEDGAKERHAANDVPRCPGSRRTRILLRGSPIRFAMNFFLLHTCFGT